uniref:Vitellogenin n=1 Tax=Penaeus merguiensis TaxID=71412 RepID=A0A8F4Y562_PENME|nr:vitellogenin [Penaeus merguiensis]QXJ08931.1 vitellogenin [Penaeus merguiensis]
MTTSSLVFVLALVAGGLAAPWTAQAPRCSTECPITGSPKLAYQPEKTYTYAYSGKSRVQLKGVEDGVTELEWSKQVELTWITPCDMAITIKHAKVDGAAGADVGFLERYPLVVAVADGRIQHVCTHPGDAPWSINMKKGIATTLQNSLPSLSPFSSGLTITETDVVGKCPTKYEIETEGEKVIVVKEKNHRQCQERFPTPAETPAPWLKAPLPIEESRSECKQEITNGIYTAIMCQDKNIVRPAFGVYKYVEANQESTLRFISESSDASAISAIPRAEFQIESLLYNHEMVKEPELAPELDEVMKQICQKTMETIEPEAAALVDKALHLLRRVPVSVVEATAEKVRGGRYCGNSARLESIFLDAIAFVHESGAVKIMVQEIESGRATGGRLALYTAALYLTPRPNIEAVEALKPLFESPRPVPSVTLAAATMVNNYCRHTPHCNETAPVKEIAEILATKVQRQCSPSVGEEVEKEALATLKALGNMGVITPAVTRAAVGCIEQEGVETSIRVAATHVFRQTKCYRPAVQKLVSIAVRPAFETEIRIASYLAAIRCAEKEHLQEIFEKISVEENTQVRGFILGHMLNIQESTCPTKENLRYLLTNFVIPTDFERDFRKFSRSMEIGYHSSSFGLGGDVESNIIYAPGSFIPRAVNFNLKAAVDETHMDLGEIGARFEGMDPIIEELFGPEGYLHTTSFGKILEDITGFAKAKGSKIINQIKRTLRSKRSIDFDTISNFFNKLYGERNSEGARAEVYARFMGQEFAYGNVGEIFKGETADRLIETFFSYLEASFEQMKNLNLNTARTAQLFLDYSLPTIQGSPLKLKLDVTAVAGLTAEGKLSIAEILADLGNLDTHMKLLPNLSVHVSGFAGYDNHLSKVGIEMESTISTANGAAVKIRTAEGKKIEIELEIPEKMELLNVRAETFLVKTVGQRQMKLTPSTMRDARIKHESCIDVLEPMLGLKTCYAVNIPDIFRNNVLPLGEPIVAKFYVEKADPSMTGYAVSAAIKNSFDHKVIKVNAKAAGATTPRQAELTLSYKKEVESTIAFAKLESSTVTTGIWTTLTTREGFKTLETFMQFKTEQIDLSRGIKMDVTIKGNAADEEYEVKVFSGRRKKFTPELLVLETKLIKKAAGSDVNLEVICKTKNALAEFLTLDINVAADFKIITPSALMQLRQIPRFHVALPVHLHKMEINAAYGNWKLESYLRENQVTGETCEHISAFRITKGRRGVVSIEASHKIEGRIFENIIIRNEAKVGIGSASYKIAYDVIYHTGKMGVSFELLDSRISGKVVALEAMYINQGQEHSTKFMLEIPGYIRKIKMENMIESTGEGRYMLESAIKYGQQILLHANGPIVAKFTNNAVKLQTDMKIAELTNEPYTIGINIIFANKKQVFVMEIKGREEPVFGVEWKLVRESPQKTTVDLGVVLSTLIDNKISAVITEELIHVSFNNDVLPNTPLHRRVKGFVDVNITEKKANINFSWDVDNDATRKLIIDAALINSPANPGHAEIHGNIVFAGEPYHIKLEVIATSLLMKTNGETGFRMTVTTPTQRTVALDALVSVEHEEAKAKVTTTFRFKSLEEKEYRLISEFGSVKLSDPHSYTFEAKIIGSTPEGETKIESSFKHQMTNGERTVTATVAVEAPVLRDPFMAVFTIHNAEGSYTGVCKMEGSAPATVFEWNLKMTPEGGIEDIEAALDMKAVVRILKTVRAMATFQEEAFSLYGGGNERSSYQYRFSKPTPTSYTMMVKIPSRTMQGKVKLSPSESRITFSPNKGRTDAKYEVGYKVRHEESWGGRTSKWEARANHPTLPKPILAAIQYTANEETFKGTVELDIFSEEQDKLTGTLETQRIAENAFRTEVILAGRMLRVNPKVTITAANSYNTFGFEMMVQKTPAAAPSFAISTKYDKTSAQSAAVALTVQLEKQPVFEFSGVIEPEEGVSCNGVNMKAIMYAPEFGKYHVFSKICKPAFVEVTTVRHGGENKYTARFGLQFPDTAEFGLYASAGEELHHVALAAVRLTSPTMVKAEVAYKREEAEMIMVEASENAMRVMRFIETLAMNVFHFLEEEAAAKGVHFPSPQFVALMEEAKEEIRGIFQDILTDFLILDARFIHDILESPIVSYMSRVYLSVWSQIARLQRQLLVGLTETLKELGGYGNVTDTIMEIIMQIVRMVETRELPEFVRELLEEIKTTKLYKMVKKAINSLIQEYPEEYEAIKFVVMRAIATLERDISIIRERIMEMPAVQKIIEWIIHHFKSDGLVAKTAEEAVNRFLEEILFFSVETGRDHAILFIPLHQPVNSLTQFAQQAVPNPVVTLQNLIWSYVDYIPIPVEHAIWAYYNFVPRHMKDLLPPYSRTAMVVSSTEILTFNGLVLRAPRSPCKVLLAAHASHRLMMSHPQPSAPPQIELKTPAATVVIKPNFEILVNGQPSRRSEETIGNVWIENKAEEIVVRCPFMKVTVAKKGEVVAVEASRWISGRVAGLLGPNNGEIGDDRLMPSGATASSPRELVGAWQEDQHCPTPELRPAETTTHRVIQCEVLLGFRSRCNPVVQPKSFIDICHVAQNPCSAAKAYRTICALNGVEEIFPLEC